MAVVVILLAALIGAGGSAFAIFKVASGSQSGPESALDLINAEQAQKSAIAEKLRQLYQEMTDIGVAKEKIKEFKAIQEGVKAERGRVTITQAELETVETRLRELEEIERELEASGLETKEEITILEKKQKELTGKNEELKARITESSQKWDALLKEVESNSRLKDGLQAAQTELIQTEEKTNTLMMQIEQCNEQYFILKRRYDALDIEYAQLYEKFSEAEAMVNAAKEKKDN